MSTKLSYDFPVVRENLPNSVGKDTGFDAIYRKDSGVNLGVVSKEYKLITHKEAIDSVLRELGKRKFPPVTMVSEATSYNGARLFATFCLKKETRVGVTLRGRKVGDVVSPGFTVINSYDRTIKFDLRSYVLRLVCLNGAMVSEDLFHLRKRHLNSLDLPDMVDRFAENFSRFDDLIIPTISRMSQRNVTPKILEEELNSIPGWMQDESMEYLEKQGFISMIGDGEEGPEIEIAEETNKWDLLNAFTFVLTHSQSSTPERKMELNEEISQRFWEN